MDRSGEVPPLKRARYVLHVVTGMRISARPSGGHSASFDSVYDVKLLDRVLDLFDSEPRFLHFTLPEVRTLELYLTIRPEHFERVERAVEMGRLLIGPWYVDPNMLSLLFSSREYFIRNLLIGLQTARALGRAALTSYLAGIPAYAPQVLRSFGIQTALRDMRWDAPSAEHYQQGDDGSLILVGHAYEAMGQTFASLRQRIAPYSESGNVLITVPLPDSLEEVEAFLRSLPDAQRELHDDVFHSNLAAYTSAIELYAPQAQLPIQPAEELLIVDPVVSEAETMLLELEMLLAWAGTFPPRRDEQHLRRPQRLLQKLWRHLLDGSLSDDLQLRRMVSQQHEAALADLSAQTEPPYAPHIIAVSDPTFTLTAIKPPEDAARNGLIVRGYNQSTEPIWVTLTPFRPFTRVEVVRMDETPTGGKLAPESNGAFQFQAEPYHLLTFWLHD